MRKTFPGYYRPTEDEFSELWKNCLFVLDANVLLNLYRYSQETSGSFTAILDQISDRLWVPHQAALEYQRRRLDVIAQQAKAYDEIQKLLDETQNQLESRLRAFQRHPLIDVDRSFKRIERTFTTIKRELNKRKQEHPDLLEDDHLRATITSLFDGKVGSPYSQEQLDEIYKRGKVRYEREVPPGYLDVNKEGVRKYGDLVLWFQVIDKAKETKETVILVTDDRKEDWWLRFKGQTIGPRPELVEEMLSQAGVSFYMYQADPFMEHAQKYLERQVKQEAIDEVRDIRRHDEAYMKAVQAAALRLPYGTLAEAALAASRIPYDTWAEAALAASRIPRETLAEAVLAASRIPRETLAEAVLAASRIPRETLAEAALAASRIPRETLAEAVLAASRIPYDTLAEAVLAASLVPHETLRKAALVASRIPEETTESTTPTSSDIPLDSEPEEETDGTDEQFGMGDE